MAAGSDRPVSASLPSLVYRCCCCFSFHFFCALSFRFSMNFAPHARVARVAADVAFLFQRTFTTPRMNSPLSPHVGRTHNASKSMSMRLSLRLDWWSSSSAVCVPVCVTPSVSVCVCVCVYVCVRVSVCWLCLAAGGWVGDKVDCDGGSDGGSSCVHVLVCVETKTRQEWKLFSLLY